VFERKKTIAYHKLIEDHDPGQPSCILQVAMDTPYILRDNPARMQEELEHLTRFAKQPCIPCLDACVAEWCAHLHLHMHNPHIKWSIGGVAQGIGIALVGPIPRTIGAQR
jgi:hypothetical protein